MNIVILSFGPSKNSTAAVRRARRLAGTSANIVVVPATTLGRPAKSIGATTIEATGSEGMRQALAGLTGPTLVIHDDAALGARALTTLLAELERHGCVLVPGTNDVGSDHFVGVLPPVEAAGSALGHQRSSHAGQELRKVIPTALFGHPEELSLLIDSKIVDPRTTLTATGLRMVGSAAVATHNGTCRSRTHAPDAADGRPLLVASMIVKDEAETLDECLISLDGLVDRIDLVDTGSCDNTIEIARRHGANVTEIEWREDFAWARNQALEQSKDAHFVLQVDADERVRCPDPTEFRRFLATFGDEYQGFQPRILNFHDLDRTLVASEFRATRIFTTADTAFVGAIHEAPVLVSKGGVAVPSSPLDMLWIDHIGYAQHFIGSRDKARRNVRIAEADVEAGENFRSLFHYARALQLVDPTDPTIADHFQRALTYEDQANEQTRAHAYGSLAHYALGDGDVEGALELAMHGAGMVAGDELCAAAACEALDRLGRNRDILEVLERRRVGSPIAPLFTTQHLQNSLASHEVGALAATGRFEEAYSAALALLATTPASFRHWAALINAAKAHTPDPAEVIALAAVCDPTGSFDRVVFANFDATTAARFAVRYFEHGGTWSPVAATGILTSIVAENVESAMALTVPAGQLGLAVIRKLAAMADDRGYPEVGDALLGLMVA